MELKFGTYKVKLKKGELKRYVLISMLGLGLVIIFVSIISILNSSRYIFVAGTCGAGGVPCASNPSLCDGSTIGCHYGNDPAHAHSGAGGTSQTSNCTTSNTFRVDVSRYNVCNYTHNEVCVQDGWNNTPEGCRLSADWECCDPAWAGGPEEKGTYRAIALPDGSFPNEADFYKGEGVEGRLQVASCNRLMGWAGTKSDYMEPVNVFFTIGAKYGDPDAIVFNPEIKATLLRESAVCDFLDNKSDGPVEECKTCVGTSCNHGFDIDLSNYKDSPIFNGKAGNEIYAYGTYQEELNGIQDGATATKWFLTIDENCGEGWDGKSDEAPIGQGREFPTGTPTPTGVVGSGTPSPDPTNTIEQPYMDRFNFDTNLDGLFDIRDFQDFVVAYIACNNPNIVRPQTTEACLKYIGTNAVIDFDLNEDSAITIQDFALYVPAYITCNNPDNPNAQSSVQCEALKD